MDEDLKRAIEDLHVVSSVRFHAGDKTHKAGVYANLRCSAASSHGGCGAKLVGPVRMSSKRPTLQDCLRELGRLIQQDHGPTCVAAAQELQAAEKDAADASTKRSHDEGAASLNANQVLMLHSRLKIIQARAAQANKAGIARKGQQILWRGSSKGPNLARGRAYRLAKCGQLRRRLTCGLDTFGSASSGRFLVA